MLDFLNRVDEPDFGASIGILYTGGKPKIEASIARVGTRDYSINNLPSSKYQILKGIFGLLMIALICIALILLILKALFLSMNIFGLRDRRKKLNDLVKEVYKNKLFDELPQDEIKQMVSRIIYLQDKEFFERRSKSDRWLMSLKKPVIEDYAL